MAPHVAFLDKAVSVRPGCVCVWKTGAEERGGVSHSCPGYRGSVETKQCRGVALDVVSIADFLGPFFCLCGGLHVRSINSMTGIYFDVSLVFTLCVR